MNSVYYEVVLHLANVVPILVFKITVIMVGYFIVKLGANLLIQGISGDFKFTQPDILKGVGDGVGVKVGVAKEMRIVEWCMDTH